MDKAREWKNVETIVTDIDGQLCTEIHGGRLHLIEYSAYQDFHARVQELESINKDYWQEIERLRGALDKVNWHDMDCEKEFKDGFCGCPGYFAEQALAASIERFGESKKGE